jgi:NAD(P)-dependent dehydrogenase (short-subunit alcohol dehydrogenase family)
LLREERAEYSIFDLVKREASTHLLRCSHSLCRNDLETHQVFYSILPRSLKNAEVTRMFDALSAQFRSIDAHVISLAGHAATRLSAVTISTGDYSHVIAFLLKKGFILEAAEIIHWIFGDKSIFNVEYSRNSLEVFLCVAEVADDARLRAHAKFLEGRICDLRA